METSDKISTKAEPRWERRKDARPKELAHAALELFVEKGFAATRLEDVAARAGVSKGTLYLYFDSKEALFKEVVASGIVPAIAEAEQTFDQYQGSSAALLRDLVLGWWRVIGTTQLSGVPKLMISESQNFPEVARFYHAEVIQRGTALFARTLERGIRSGEFRPVDVEYTVRCMVAPVIMRAVWMHSFAPCAGPDIDAEKYFEHMLDLMVNGLAPRTENVGDLK